MRGTPRINWSLYHAFYDGKPALFPTDRDQLLQWLYSLDENGLQIKDNLALVALPETRGVNCLGYDGISGVTKTLISQPTFPFSFGGTFICSPQVSDGTLLGLYNTTANTEIWALVLKATGALQLKRRNSVDGANDLGITPHVSLTDGEPHEVKLYSLDETTTRVFVDGVFSGETTVPIGMPTLNKFATGSLSRDTDSTFYTGSASTLAYEENSEIDVIVYAGQSNCKGQANSLTLSDAEKVGQDHLFTYKVGVPVYAEDQNLQLKPDPAYGWGAEIIVSRSMNKRTAFLKCGINGASVIVDYQQGGDAYVAFKSVLDDGIQSLIDAGYNPTIKCVMWQQGESEAEINTWWPIYHDYFVQFKSDIESETVLTSIIPWFVAKLSDTQTGLAYLDEMREVQDGMNSIEGVTVFSIDGAEINTADYVHFTENGQVTIGERYAEVLSVISFADITYDISQPYQEGYGLPNDVSGNSNHATSNTATWTTADGIPTANGLYGFTPAVVSDGSGQYILDTFIADENTVIEDVCSFGNDIGSARFVGASDGALQYAYGQHPSGDWFFAWKELFATTTAPYVVDKITAVRIDAGKLFVDGVVVSDLSSATGGFPQIEQALYGRNDSGVVALFTDQSVLGRKVWQSGILIRDMIPLPDGRFWDKVNKVAYGTPTGTLVTDYHPALQDGSGNDAVNNLPLAVAGSILEPNLHNGWEGSNLQTDANFSIFGGATVYGDGATLWTPLSYEDLLSVQPYDRNNVIRWKKDTIGTSGQCLVIDEIQYPTSYVFTLAGYNQTERWRLQYNKDESCGATALPFDFSFDFSNEDNSANIASIT